MKYYGLCRRSDHMHTPEAGCWEDRWRDTMAHDDDELVRHRNLRDVERKVRLMGKDQRAKEASMDLLSGTKDARGRVLQEGDEVILNVKGPIYFRIASITPSLDPGAPADLLMVHAGVMVAFVAKRGAINSEFIRVRTLQEAGPTNFTILDAKPATEDPPV